MKDVKITMLGVDEEELKSSIVYQKFKTIGKEIKTVSIRNFTPAKVKNFQLFYDKKLSKLLLITEYEDGNIVFYEFNEDDYWYISDIVRDSKTGKIIGDLVMLKDSALTMLCDLLKVYCYIDVRFKKQEGNKIITEGTFIKFKEPINPVMLMLLEQKLSIDDLLKVIEKHNVLANVIERIDKIERVEIHTPNKNLQHTINAAITKTRAKLLRKNLGLPIGIIVPK